MAANNVPNRANNRVVPTPPSNTDTRIIVQVIGPNINMTSESRMSNTDWQTFMDAANTTYSRFKPGYAPDYTEQDLFMIFLDKNLSIPLETFSLKYTKNQRDKKPLTVELASNNMPELNTGMRKRK